MVSADSAPHLSPTTAIALPWRAPSFAAVKGIIHAPGAKPTMKPEREPDALLSAIAKAPGMGRMTLSGSAALPPSPNLSNVRARGALQSRPKIETVSMPIFEPRMNKDFTLGSAHEDDVTPLRVATSSPSGETIMTKPIVSFGAIVAIFTLPLAAYAQPIGGTAAPGAPTRPAAAHLVRLRARRFRQRRQAPAELDHVAIAVLPVIQELEVRENVLEHHGSWPSSAILDAFFAPVPMSPSPGLGEKYFSYLPGTLSHSLASAGGSFLATMLGQTFENSALTLNHFSSPGSVSGLIASTGHSGSHTPQSMHSSGWMTSIFSPS